MDGLWATKSEDVGLIVHAISFQDFHLCDPDRPTSQTDGRTDGQRTVDAQQQRGGEQDQTNYVTAIYLMNGSKHV